MLRFRFVLNEMKKEIEESTEVTSHGFAIVFFYYPFASALVASNCLILKGLTGTS